MPDSPQDSHHSPFPTTSWSLVQRVQKGSDADAEKAMADICQLYWYPIYAFARRHGFSAHDAEDLTQIFFQELIARETIQAARQERGKLRTFMLNLLTQVVSRQSRHEHALKRGGGQPPAFSFDELDAEQRYLHEPLDHTDSARVFDRAWAGRVIAHAEARLREDYAKAKNLDTFESIRCFLPSDGEGSYADIATRLGTREGTVRLQVHRMRKRFAELVDEEIAQTVSDAAELPTERDYLIGLVGAG